MRTDGQQTLEFAGLFHGGLELGIQPFFFRFRRFPPGDVPDQDEPAFDPAPALLCHANSASVVVIRKLTRKGMMTWAGVMGSGLAFLTFEERRMPGFSFCCLLVHPVDF